MTAQIKLILAGVLAAIALAVVGVIWYQHHEVGTLTTQNATDKTVIADQATSVSEAHATVTTAQQSSAITVNTLVQAASETTATTNVANAISTTQAQQEQVVIQAYASAPAAASTIPSPAKVITVGKTTIDTSKTTETDALSAVRIQAMWDTYCKLNPKEADVKACAANQ